MNYYLIAGEASGDLHGSNLMKALKERDPDARFRCWGGDLMQGAGGDLVRHYRDLAFMGFWEVLAHLGTIVRNLRFCRKDLLDFQPDVCILIDYPGFNLRMATFAHRHQIPVFYYISPQLWAWKSSRIRIIRETVTRMFVILPFEEAFYAQHNYPVDFVGHPLLDVLHSGRESPDRATFLQRNQLSGKPIIALLPGSRSQEIKTMLRLMIRIVASFPEYQFVVGAAPSVPLEIYASMLSGTSVAVVTDQTYDLLDHAEAALVTSGTATLETALIGIPEVVCYKGSRLSFWIARRIVNVPFISLVNLIMEREVVKELIQDSLTPERLAAELNRLFDPPIRNRMQEDFRTLIRKLGGPGASDRTAGRMIQYLQEKSVNYTNK